MNRKQSSTKSPSFSNFRIISGIWRRRKLPFPEIDQLRPTPDRVRETVFNWLADALNEQHCLDLFAGSGALGLEALSRGATHCTFIDSHPMACATIKQNLETLKAENYAVTCGDLPNVLQGQKHPFNVIFIDPPYNSPELIADCVNYLNASGLIANNAWLYIETAKKTTLPYMDLPVQLHKEKTFGQVKSYLFTVEREE